MNATVKCYGHTYKVTNGVITKEGLYGDFVAWNLVDRKWNSCGGSGLFVWDKMTELKIKHKREK